MGAALINLGDLKCAEAAYIKSLHYDPESKLAKEQLMCITSLKGAPSTNGTLESCDLLLEEKKLPSRIHPDFAQAFVVLGRVFMEGEDYESAIKYYTQAIDIEPDLASAHAGIALAYKKAGFKDLAVKHAKIALELEEKKKQKEE